MTFPKFGALAPAVEPAMSLFSRDLRQSPRGFGTTCSVSDGATKGSLSTSMNPKVISYRQCVVI